MDIDSIPFANLPLESVRQTYTYGQLLLLDKKVAKLNHPEIVHYLEQRLNTLDWIRMSLVFIQHTDAYMQTSCATRSWEDLVSYRPEDPEDVLFYSKSKVERYRPSPHIPVDWKRVLSNFYPSHIVLHGLEFPTAEHAFHGLKILQASEGNLECGLEALLADKCPTHAKKVGGRVSFKKLNIVLDIEKWQRIREDVQRQIIGYRLRFDPIFVRVLRWTSQRTLVHFERGTHRRPPFWGAFRPKETVQVVGQNRLGEILMEARSLL